MLICELFYFFNEIYVLNILCQFEFSVAAGVGGVSHDHQSGHILLVVGEAGIGATVVTAATGWVLVISNPIVYILIAIVLHYECTNLLFQLSVSLLL